MSRASRGLLRSRMSDPSAPTVSSQVVPYVGAYRCREAWRARTHPTLAAP
jgi:hypothetical protein